MAEAALDPAVVKNAMRLMASGVTVITTEGAAGRAGLTVSSFSSLSLEPPSVLFCVHEASSTLPSILANGVFGASVLAHGQHQVAEAFAGFLPAFKEDRFGAGSWYSLASSVPLLEGALCGFDCALVESYAFGTHRIVAGRIIAVATQTSASPLLYSDRAYHRLQRAA
ncbi:flavin reductase/cob(II)yrinic acid a,c-diamide reductase [Arboricoccus pini]|uniref:Flavin reductase/cob(II)yrinic acid a,c-diamide reductase n=1 Tax=Arboricoccus pini TaxID=1963835 RepID=A0A212RJA4_9PROT|nr:flavin reductase family protein [Arboricoccus pini]SNB72501.1 flavin reductase/cob(II)yrinic acid a,c-diamide reductase [Arboricoccus pini]